MNSNQVSFSETEYNQMSYLLGVLQDTLTDNVSKLASMGNQYGACPGACPGVSKCLERMRIDVETLASFRERIEAR